MFFGNDNIRQTTLPRPPPLDNTPPLHQHMNIRYRKLIFSLVAFAYREIKSERKENKNAIKILFVLSFMVYKFFFHSFWLSV